MRNKQKTQILINSSPGNVPEMMAFVALLIAMGINKSSQYRMYWSKSEILHITFYPSIMSRNRFSSFIRFLHVSNSQMPRTASAKQDKLAKVRPLIVLIPKFLNLYKATDADLGNTFPCFNHYLWKVSLRVVSCPIRASTDCFNLSQRCSMGFKSRDAGGHSILKTPSSCINSMHRRCRAAIDNRGGYTPY